jgi:hypothetical protein
LGLPNERPRAEISALAELKILARKPCPPHEIFSYGFASAVLCGVIRGETDWQKLISEYCAVTGVMVPIDGKAQTMQ